MHQPVFLPHPLLCRNISSVLFAIVASSGLKSLVIVCLPLTLFCEIWKRIKVGKKANVSNSLFTDKIKRRKFSGHFRWKVLSAKTIPFKRSNFSSHAFFKTQWVLFLFTFLLSVFICGKQFQLPSERKSVDLKVNDLGTVVVLRE